MHDKGYEYIVGRYEFVINRRERRGDITWDYTITKSPNIIALGRTITDYDTKRAAKQAAIAWLRSHGERAYVMNKRSRRKA